MQLNELTYQVIGAAMEVHRVLGAGFLESVYEDALCWELSDRDTPYEKQKEIGVNYKGIPVGVSRLDILVDKRLILELKAVDDLHPIHTAQLISYLKITELHLGLLINFNVTVLKNGIKRIAL